MPISYLLQLRFWLIEDNVFGYLMFSGVTSSKLKQSVVVKKIYISIPEVYTKYKDD